MNAIHNTNNYVNECVDVQRLHIIASFLYVYILKNSYVDAARSYFDFDLGLIRVSISHFELLVGAYNPYVPRGYSRILHNYETPRRQYMYVPLELDCTYEISKELDNSHVHNPRFMYACLTSYLNPNT